MDFSEKDQKKLYRSKADRYIAGLSGGLGDYFNTDANLFRILFVLLTFAGGIGIILYIIGMIIVPENPSEDVTQKGEARDRSFFWAILLICVGALLLFKEFGFFNYFHFWHIPWSSIWAVFLILIGVLIIYSGSRKTTDSEGEEKSGVVLNSISRSKKDRMIAGVCAGIANYFKIDPAIVRLLWVLASLASIGLGVLVYLVLIFVLPEASETSGSESA